MKGSDYIKYKFSFKNVKYLTYCNLQIKILNTVNANKIRVTGQLFIFKFHYVIEFHFQKRTVHNFSSKYNVKKNAEDCHNVHIVISYQN